MGWRDIGTYKPSQDQITRNGRGEMLSMETREREVKMESIATIAGVPVLFKSSRSRDKNGPDVDPAAASRG